MKAWVDASPAAATINPGSASPVGNVGSIPACVSNALDAMEPPGPRRERALRVETELTKAEEITVRVADRGVGIADSDLESVFEPFFSTKSSGLGIGLSISRKIIEAHGGTLRAQANPGGGAVFQFTLPIATKKD